MAITSPDGLISPDASDPYDLTADWAASMSSVQAALLNRANQVGSSSLRTGSTPAKGTIWWDTTLGQAFIYNGSAWLPMTEGDTGWVDISSYGTVSGVSSAWARRIGKAVQLEVSGSLALPTNGFLTVLTDLPGEFRPWFPGSGQYAVASGVSGAEYNRRYLSARISQAGKFTLQTSAEHPEGSATCEFTAFYYAN